MGKTVGNTPKRVNTSIIYHPPPNFLEKYKLYFDTIPLLLTVSCDIHLYTIEKIEDRENATLLQCLQKVISMYNSKGFDVQFILADRKFRHMTDSVPTELK